MRIDELPVLTDAVTFEHLSPDEARALPWVVAFRCADSAYRVRHGNVLIGHVVFVSEYGWHACDRAGEVLPEMLNHVLHKLSDRDAARIVFHAHLEEADAIAAVEMSGHTFDVTVGEREGGRERAASICVEQDAHSGLILSWTLANETRAS